MKDSKVKKLPIRSTETSEKITVFHRAEKYLNTSYHLRFNEISLQIECRGRNNKEWQICNEDSIWIELQKQDIKVSQSGFKSLLKSDFVPRYNPFVEYYESLPRWYRGGRDYIKEFASYVKLIKESEREQFEIQFKKWCVRTVKCAIYPSYFNKQAFVLTDDGRGQNIGKSTYLRFLCPPELSDYFAEDINGSDKDSRILLCKNLIINLDELAALSRKDINQLKSLFSKDKINERLPYDSKNSIIPRTASFVGSTNMSTFLHDETGSVRWLCFGVNSIDWTYKKNFDINNLWMQAYALSQDKSYVAEMTHQDIVENELRNDKYQFLTAERELLHKYFEPSTKEDGQFMTPSDIAKYMNIHAMGVKVNHINIGKALSSMNYQRVKYNGIYGYYVKTKPLELT
jgi:predicted P-loop ATPase